MHHLKVEINGAAQRDGASLRKAHKIGRLVMLSASHKRVLLYVYRVHLNFKSLSQCLRGKQFIQSKGHFPGAKKVSHDTTHKSLFMRITFCLWLCKLSPANANEFSLFTFGLRYFLPAFNWKFAQNVQVQKVFPRLIYFNCTEKSFHLM